MAVLGSFIGVVFEVSNKRINTFNNFTRSGDASYEKHNIKGSKPLLEFDGDDIETATFDIKLSKSLGVNPLNELEKWKVARRRGYRGIFLIGKKPISANTYVISKITENHTTYDANGDVVTIELSIEIMEYPEPTLAAKMKAKVKPKNSTAPAAKKQKGTVTITVKSVHIRNGPGVKNKVIGYAMRNDSYKVYGTKNGWYDLGGGKYMTGDKAYSKYKAVT